jgi:hypothetical protein
MDAYSIKASPDSAPSPDALAMKPLRQWRAASYCNTVRVCQIDYLTNRWSQPLAVVISTFDFLKQFSMFATLGSASGG